MRKVIPASITFTVMLVLSCLSAHGQPASQSEIFSLGTPGDAVGKRNIILFIGDGMSYQNEIALSRYLYGTDNGLAWSDFPYEGYVTTWDIDSYNRYASRAGAGLYTSDSFSPVYGYDPSRGGDKPFGLGVIPDDDYFFTALPSPGGGSDTYSYPSTDSAAAATAIATGQKTDEGNVSWAAGDTPDGELKTIAELYRESLGGAIGVVTTVEFSHATPSPFVSHNTYRGNPGQVAHEIITVTKPDVVIGAGHPDRESGYISRSDYNTIKNSDEYIFVERAAGIDGGESLLDAAQQAVNAGKKLFGLYGGSGGCFDRYAPHDSPGSPGFDRNPENPTLADTVEAALIVLSQDPDGFFVMFEQGDIDWANHHKNYIGMIGAMYDLEMAVREAVDFVNRPGDDVDWSNTLLLITADHVTGSLRMSDDVIIGIGDLPTMTGTSNHYTFPDGEARYITTVHTNEPVMLYAMGPQAEIDSIFTTYEGSWYPGTLLIDNTQIFKIMADFAGIEY